MPINDRSTITRLIRVRFTIAKGQKRADENAKLVRPCLPTSAMSPVSLGTVDSFVAALLDEMLIIHDDVCIISLAAERTCQFRTSHYVRFMGNDSFPHPASFRDSPDSNGSNPCVLTMGVYLTNLSYFLIRHYAKNTIRSIETATCYI